jgi:hypothetical protein
MVLAAVRDQERHHELLFHQLRAMHDDDFWHWRLVLPKPRLQWGAQFGAGDPPPALLIRVAGTGRDRRLPRGSSPRDESRIGTNFARAYRFRAEIN